MHKRLNIGLDLGLAGNVLFLIFAVLTYVYYRLFNAGSSAVDALEKIEYVLLFLGFGSFAVSALLITMAVRMRTRFKAALWLYIVMEAVIMYCELNSYDVRSFYHAYSMWLAIIHAVISSAACFAFIELDPYKKPFEILIIVCVGVILVGMMGTVFNVRVYFSVIMNALSFTVLFSGIKYMMSHEIIEIDCHGDSARVAEYRGFFEGDEQKTDAQKAAEKKKDSEKTNP